MGIHGSVASPSSSSISWAVQSRHCPPNPMAASERVAIQQPRACADPSSNLFSTIPGSMELSVAKHGRFLLRRATNGCRHMHHHPAPRPPPRPHPHVHQASGSHTCGTSLLSRDLRGSCRCSLIHLSIFSITWAGNHNTCNDTGMSQRTCISGQLRELLGTDCADALVI
jgi:hypothetical protein